MQKTLRIATFNIHKGVTSFRSMPRIHALKQALTTMEADILFLQEVQGRHDRHAVRHAHLWPDEAQHEFLASDSQHSAYGMNAVYDHGHHGNVSDHAFEQRGILHCVVQTPKVDVHCFVVHLGLFAGGRRRQTQALIDAVQASASAGEPVIIAGDFNDWGNQLGADLRNRLGVCEVFDEQNSAGSNSLLHQLGWQKPKIKPARTFPAVLPWLRLDRIYVRGLGVEHSDVCEWRRISDHVALRATLSLP